MGSLLGGAADYMAIAGMVRVLVGGRRKGVNYPLCPPPPGRFDCSFGVSPEQWSEEYLNDEHTDTWDVLFYSVSIASSPTA